MPWFRVDDQLHSHPKARRAGAAAIGLWALAGSHCMSYLTDGVVERWFVDTWPDGRELAQRLVDAGLWHEHPDGWVFHDWPEYQPTREKILAERAATRERVQKHRAKRVSNAVTNGVRTTAPVPVPDPDFYKTSKSQSRNNRASVSTDAIEISPMTKRLAAQQGITNLRTVVDAVFRATGIAITADQAFQVSAWLLGKAKEHPAAPQRYVLAAIEQSPFEVQKHIHEEVA